MSVNLHGLYPYMDSAFHNLVAMDICPQNGAKAVKMG